MSRLGYFTGGLWMAAYKFTVKKEGGPDAETVKGV
jgi:hypothetical protein